MNVTPVILEDGIFNGHTIDDIEIDMYDVKDIIRMDICGFACEANVFKVVFNTYNDPMICIIN